MTADYENNIVLSVPQTVASNITIVRANFMDLILPAF